MVAAGSPGGGLDIHARAIEQALTVEKMLDKPFTIMHKGGGGGNITTSYLVNQKGNGYVLGINSNRVLLNELMGTIEYGYKDLTPVARLTTEYDCLGRSGRLQVQNGPGGPGGSEEGPHLRDLRRRHHPQQRPVQYPAARQSRRAIDYSKIKIVVFDAGGDAMAKLLGDHVPILSVNISEISAQLEAGKIRILAVSVTRQSSIAYPTYPPGRISG